MEATKRCCTCHRELPLAAFNRRSRAADGLQSRCRDCSRAWYEQHRAAHMANAARRSKRARDELAARLHAYLQDRQCIDCRQGDIRCLDFDHRDPMTKAADVVTLVNQLVSWPRIEEEIAKCDVRCANCHRRRTATQLGTRRQRFYEAQQRDRQAIIQAFDEADETMPT